MNVKYLRKLRKNYNYKFSIHGVILRRKSDGCVETYNSSAQLIRDFLLDTSNFIASSKWKKRKNKIIYDQRWKSIYTKAHWW